MTNLYYMVVRYQAPPILKFTSTGQSTVYLQNSGSNVPDCEYSADKQTWTAMPTTVSSAVSLTDGQSIYVRGNNPDGFSKSPSNYSTFTMTGSISASGNIMSLIDRTGETTTIPAEYCFNSLFYNCASLTTAPDLPATTLTNNCYCFMFGLCSALTSAPELPATELESGCYYCMFGNCTALTTPPMLPATTLYSSSYSSMFSGCTSLKVRNSSAEGATLFFTCPSTVSSGAVSYMFYGTSGSYKSNPVANGTYYYYQ